MGCKDKEQAVFEQLPNFQLLQEVEFHSIKRTSTITP